ncbi:MAG: hypothetical protein LBG74_02120 [Spirochaetaceae bacterium]|jgi:hypothetical protein|nr:hypothetical protein [Spirochaetaceae bacterium]
MINSLSQSVIISVDNINNTTPINIKKGESLRLSVKVSTDKFNIVGGAYCKVSITGMGAKIPEAVYKIEPDNLFYLIIHTAKYFAGYYNAHIELMLDKTAQEIRKNPEYNFSFTVLSSVSHQENPLLLPAGEYWEGHITYNFNGKSYTDIYTILLDEFEGDHLCRISLKSLSLEKETSFLGDGTWSINGEFIEIKGFLNGSKSNRSIHWTSSYKFTAKNSFALLVPPYPDASNARIVFMRTKK